MNTLKLVLKSILIDRNITVGESLYSVASYEDFWYVNDYIYIICNSFLILMIKKSFYIYIRFLLYPNTSKTSICRSDIVYFLVSGFSLIRKRSQTMIDSERIRYAIEIAPRWLWLWYVYHTYIGRIVIYCSPVDIRAWLSSIYNCKNL